MKTFNRANILIPHNIDYTKWSVVACDQYTSEPEYWAEVEKTVGDSPSSLHIIYPEIYLNEKNKDERIKSINQKMKKYLDEGIFKEYKDSLILVERTQRNGKKRYGLIGQVDLEDYDFSKGSTSKIRATEGTVIERIPPRVKIRENAPLEMPHIIMLIDDPDLTVIDPLKNQKDNFEVLYDFELQMNSGHLKGYLINDDSSDSALKAIDSLADENTFYNKYNLKKSVLQFAVGDGNHSLATAKTCWENIKKSLTDEEKKTHPARFALVEVMNIHDPALEFEPIHRFVYNIKADDLLKSLFEFYPQASKSDNGGQKIDYCYKGNSGSIYINNAPSNLAVGTLGKFLDAYLKENGGDIDYIHGKSTVEKLAQKDNSIGFILPSMEKKQLFETVILDGSLPRKTFSMGEAEDKRFYFECKNIQ